MGRCVEEDGWHARFVTEPRCAFCGKGRSEVQRLEDGPQVLICDECISLSMQIIADLKPRQNCIHDEQADQSATPLYFGTINKNWAALSSDDLIDRFHREKAAENLNEERQKERYRAIFQILRSRNMSISVIWQKLHAAPMWQSLPDIGEMAAASEAVEEGYVRFNEDKVSGIDDLDAKLGKNIELRKTHKLKIAE